MLPVFFADWPLLLLPTHIVFLELIIDPSCSLVFEAEPTEAGVMKRQPRNPKDSLFSRDMVGLALLQGLSMLAICMAVFLVTRQNHTPDAVRALTFSTLVASVLVVLVANRSSTRTMLSGLFERNIALWYVLGGTAVFLPIVLLVPFAQRLFRFAPLHTGDLILSLSAGLACAVWFDFLKLAKRWSKSRHSA
jgi:Ca2+-transporting ATPase